MKHLSIIYSFLVITFLFSCTKENNEFISENSVAASKSLYTSYTTGSAADVSTSTLPGLVLMGGGTDVDAAIKWMLLRSGGGDIVVIRSSGSNGYNNYMNKLATVNSVESIIIDSRTKAMIPEIAQKIKNAEALFIAGGDQWDYVNYWKNTPVEDAINYLINTKRVTVGGTSAGLAILGSDYFSAQAGTVVSADALSNPYNSFMALGHSDFIASPNLLNTITDSHYSQRGRQGRHIAFMARMMQDYAMSNVKGIGVDEQTAVCIDENGIGKVFGLNAAYFMNNSGLGPETCVSGSSLTWNRSTQAISTYKIQASATGNGYFNSNTWLNFSGGVGYFNYVVNGTL